MPRGARLLSNVGLYHIIVRGNNKTRLFHSKHDFEAIQTTLKNYLLKWPIRIHHYCIMTNHMHLLIGADEILPISRYMHAVQRAYHHYYRKNYTLFGHLFQGRYRSLPIETDAYLLDCGRYIERNPVRAKMVDHPKDWPHSSYNVYAYGAKDSLVTLSVAFEAISEKPEERQKLYRDHVESTRPYEDVLDKELVGA